MGGVFQSPRMKRVVHLLYTSGDFTPNRTGNVTVYIRLRGHWAWVTPSWLYSPVTTSTLSELKRLGRTERGDGDGGTPSLPPSSAKKGDGDEMGGGVCKEHAVAVRLAVYSLRCTVLARRFTGRVFKTHSVSRVLTELMAHLAGMAQLAGWSTTAALRRHNRRD